MISNERRKQAPLRGEIAARALGWRRRRGDLLHISICERHRRHLSEPLLTCLISGELRCRRRIMIVV